MPSPTDVLALDQIPGFNRLQANGSLSGSRNITMLGLIGNPCGSYDDQNCRTPTNPKVVALVVTEDVGPFKVTGLRPAVDRLRTILVDVQAERPDIYALLGSAGMMCCRFVRGSHSVISNHSWGTAIDLKITGVIDTRGDGNAFRALFDIYPIFNRHGFFWGAAFHTEDAMHFEASDQLIKQWADQGEFGADTVTGTAGLTIGDRSVRVAALQSALNATLGFNLVVDGQFGALTRAAVIEFQRRQSLTATGIASRTLLKALGI